MIISAIDLKPGMLVRELENKTYILIQEVNFTNDNKIWKSPCLRYVDLNNTFWGTYFRALSLDEKFEYTDISALDFCLLLNDTRIDILKQIQILTESLLFLETTIQNKKKTENVHQPKESD